MQAYINDNNALYVTDNSPFSETHYRARFYFDPNNIVMAANDVFTLFDASNCSGTQLMSVEFQRTAADFQVRAGLRNDADTIDSARLGGVSGIDTGTRGTVYFDGFVSQRESYVGLDGGALPAPSKTDNLFADGFEGNSLAAWSGNTPDSGHLTVTSAAAIFGSKGLNVYINDNNSLYVTDITPFEESHYRAHFHFKPNGITMATNDAHYIFYGLDRSGTVQERIEFGKSSTGYQVRAGVLAGGSWTTTNWVAISNAAHYLETDWQASTASSSPYNGVFTFWVDGTQQGTYPALNTYGKTIDYVQLGGVSGIDTGTRGTEYFDAFDSHRSSYIGTATSMVPAPENTGSFVMVAYHPDSLPELVSQPRQSAGGKMASLDKAVPSLRLPITITADQLVGLNIAYTYDPLGRLTGANYSDGSFFHYSNDAVGNRLTQTTALGTVNYVYDDANRLASVGGVSYTWDNNGNLLSDGTSSYAYDHANRLKSLTQGSNTYTYAYNGMGNRVSQTLNAGTPTVYVLDQAAGLVQVLSDGSYTYLYGNDRIAQQSTSEMEYFLTDALGSVRQLTNSDGEITLNRSYDPNGNVLASSGDGESMFAFTGEQVDSYSNLINLRSRMYSSSTGRFMSRDVWEGDTNSPMSYNAWLYGYANPVNLFDPSGYKPRTPRTALSICQDLPTKALYEACVDMYYGIQPLDPLKFGENVGGSKGCYSGPTAYRAPGYLDGAEYYYGGWPMGIEGREMVYDFATMERSNFTFWGGQIGSFVSIIGGSAYLGKVFGFRTDSNVQEAYEGPFVTISGGASTEKLVGGGRSFFFSPKDPFLNGNTFYVGAALGVNWIVDISVGVTNYVRSGGITSYAPNGKVDREKLQNDILRGAGSPFEFWRDIMESNGIPMKKPLVPDYINARRWFIVWQANRYADAYDELSGK